MATLGALHDYPWTGHAALLGRIRREWQETETILSYFGTRRQAAIPRYEDFVRQGIPLGRRPEWEGGGVMRSAGGWSQGLSLRRRGRTAVADARILGRGDFVESLLAEAEEWTRQHPAAIPQGP